MSPKRMRPQEFFSRGGTYLGRDRPSEHKISVCDVSLDWGALLSREWTFVKGSPSAFIGSLESRGIELVQGPEKCARNYQISADGSILDAGKIVVATGSKS